MINSKNVELYCSEDISNIENYEQAINDQTQIWHCHHRLDITEHKTRDQLIKEDKYFNRPSSELVFLTKAAHTRLHHKTMVFLKLYFSDIGGEGCDWSCGDPYGLSPVCTGKTSDAYAVGKTVYVDKKCAEIIEEALDILRDEPDFEDADVFDVFSSEELVFVMTTHKVFADFDTLVFPNGDVFSRGTK